MGVSKKASSLLDLDARRSHGVQPAVESRIEELSDEQRELVDRMAAETVRRTER